MDAVEKIQVGGRSLGQWRDIALCDDAFDKMVPSDFRQILGHLMRIEETRLTAEQAKDAEIERLQGRLRMIVSHASGGSVQYTDEQSINDISVGISRHHNAIWAHAREKPAAEIAELTALLRECGEWFAANGCGRDLPDRIDTILNRERDNATG
jgi:hypothetical protein